MPGRMSMSMSRCRCGDGMCAPSHSRGRGWVAPRFARCIVGTVRCASGMTSSTIVTLCVCARKLPANLVCCLVFDDASIAIRWRRLEDLRSTPTCSASMAGACSAARSCLNLGRELLDILLELTGTVHGLHARSIECTTL